MDFVDRTFLVSGGTSGLGRATTLALLERGAKVVAADLRGEVPAGATFAPTDVTNSAQVQAAVDTAVELGGFAGAVSCAGIAAAAKVLSKGEPHSLDVFLKVLSGQGSQDEEVNLSLSESHVTLKTKSHRVSSNLVEGMFPNYMAVMPAESAVRIKSKRSDLLAAVRSAALTADKQTSTVIFRVSPTSLVLESNAQDVGESRIEIPVESTGDSMEVRFNPIYFIDALPTFDEDEITMELSDPSRPAVLRASQSYKHLVMPLVNT